MSATTTGAARFVDRIAKSLSTRIDRRGFLGQSALVGTALAVAPRRFVLEPISAYQAVCSCNGSDCDCGALCCDGYTEFCCTLSGYNTCPPGTSLGGWWKADGTGLCGTGPRYYMDCNASCGNCGCGSNGVCAGACSGTRCGCAQGNCNNRASGCTQFRYGQCNQATACLGPIVCRVVTCVAPWAIDASCTRTSRTDQFTATHDRPCLHRVVGFLDRIEVQPSGQVRVQGWALDFDTDASIDVHIYADSTGLQAARADRPRSDLGSVFPGQGTNHGFDVTVTVPDGARQICVYAINQGPAGAGAPNPLLGCLPLVGADPVGWLDMVAPGPRRIRVAGWAGDPDFGDAAEIEIKLDGRSVGRFLAGNDRPDVGRALPALGSRRGFDVFIDAAPGVHEVCVTAIDLGVGRDRALGCRTITVPGGAPFGFLDLVQGSAGRARVVGWAIDPDADAPVTIKVTRAAVQLANGTATASRPDVGAVFPGYGAEHGFDLSFDVPGGPGASTVCVVAVDIAGNTTTLGCRDIVV